MTDLVKAHPESKAILFFNADEPKIVVHDLDISENILKMVPKKIDRSANKIGDLVFSWISKSLIIVPTTAGQKKRRDAVLGHLGLSMISRYIPLFVEECCKNLEEWK